MLKKYRNNIEITGEEECKENIYKLFQIQSGKIDEN